MGNEEEIKLLDSMINIVKAIKNKTVKPADMIRQLELAKSQKQREMLVKGYKKDV